MVFVGRNFIKIKRFNCLINIIAGTAKQLKSQRSKPRTKASCSIMGFSEFDVQRIMFILKLKENLSNPN